MRLWLLAIGGFGVIACAKQPPPHTADDSSWLRSPPASAQQAPLAAAPAAELKRSLVQQPNPWAPPKVSEALVPTSMDKPPPAIEPPAASARAPEVPDGMPQPDPL